MLCVCVSIGAWADVPTGATSFGTSSYYLENTDGSYTIYIGADGDLKSMESTWSWGMTVPWKSANKLIVQAAETVSFSQMANTNELYILLQNVDAGKTVDFSDIPGSIADELAANLGSSNGSQKVNSIIVPNCYADDVASFAGKVKNSFASTNYYGVSGNTANAYIQSDSNSELAEIVGSADETITNVNISGTATGSTVIAAINSLTSLTDASISGTMHAGVSITITNDNITSLDFSGIKPAEGSSLTIDVSDCDNLTDINLTGANVSTVNVGEGFTGTIHVDDPSNLGFTLLPEGVAETANILGPVADPFVINGCSVTINIPEDGAGTFATIWAAVEAKLDAQFVGADKRLCELKINGPVNATDLASDAFKGINVDGVDFSGATFVNANGETDYSIISSAKSNLIHYVIMPANTPADIMVNRNFAGFTEFYAAGTYSELETTGTYSLTATVKEEGELWGVTSRMPVLGSTPTVSQIQSQTDYQYYTTGITYSPNVTNLYEIHLNGNLNARDICPASNQVGKEMGKDGHLYWDKEATETAGADSRVLITSSNAAAKGFDANKFGALVYGLATNTNNIRVIDLEGAEFSHIGDMTISDKGVNLMTSNTTKVVLPTSSSVKEIPADFMNGSTKIRSICIPSNIEVIRTRAFYTIDYIWTTPGKDDPEGANTQLDNGAMYSDGERFATNVETHVNTEGFDYCAVPTGGSYTFSSNIKLIETAAFNNTQPHTKDVYVLNTIAPECHVDAFNKAMYFGHTGFSPVITEGIITRDSYMNGDFWIAMLHYPRQTTTPNVQRYTDPTRSYSIATGMRDGKGATLYFPTQSEFIRAHAQGTYGYTWNAWDPTRTDNAVNNGTLSASTDWNAEDQGKANALYTSYKTSIGASGKEPNHKYFTFYDVSLGGASNVPEDIVPYWKINWNEVAYSTNENGGNLYPQRGTENPDFGVATARDYRGWHQFVLTEYAANTTLQEEPYRSYITDNEWWTICPTFDITRKEAALLFGKFPGLTSSSETAYPFVSKLRYVIRDYVNKRITLNFSENLTQNREHRAHETDYLKDEDGNPVYNGENKIYLGTNPDKHGELDANGVLIIDINTINDDDVVMSAGVPYLIKPAMRDNAIRQFRIFRTTQERDSYVNNISEEERSKVVAVASETLYDKMVAAKEKTGEEQMADIHAGKYTVPVFVNGTNSAVKMESVEMGTDGHPKKFQISSTQYSKSTDWKYTFVGTFYKSYMPLHSYFLGWDSSLNSGKGGARFYYYDQEDTFTKNNMTWANETGIICPTYQSDFTYTVSAATGAEDPAQWELNGLIPDDSYVAAGSGASSKSYSMVFDAPDVFEETGFATVINEVNTESDSMNRQLDVYSVDGQFMGHSLNGLSKGIYVVNGKKYVVK